MMNKHSLLLLLSIFFFVGKGNAQIPDSVQLFIDNALNIMQRHSMFTRNLDWPATRKSSYALAANAKNYADARPALQYAFNLLRDKHGWLVINDVDYRNEHFKFDDSRINANMKMAAAKGPAIYTATEAGKYAYISIPFFGGQTTKAMNDFAQRIQDSLCKVISPATRGFIIDLRLNAGGNMFPMFTGIGNIVGNGVLFETKDASGNPTGQTIISNYSMTIADTIVVSLKKNCGNFSSYPVAVIIGPVTGSAGENLAVGIRGRNKTRLFGETTAGFTSGNQGFLLPGINNGLVIGVDFLHDKNGKEYRENVQPDEFITGGDDFFNHANDKKIKAALKWLKRQRK
jgi:C-terminal processing protease CtpA/Prc